MGKSVWGSGKKRFPHRYDINIESWFGKDGKERTYCVRFGKQIDLGTKRRKELVRCAKTMGPDPIFEGMDAWLAKWSGKRRLWCEAYDEMSIICSVRASLPVTEPGKKPANSYFRVWLYEHAVRVPGKAFEYGGKYAIRNASLRKELWKRGFDIRDLLGKRKVDRWERR